MIEIYKYTFKAFILWLICGFMFFVNGHVNKYLHSLANTRYKNIIFVQVNIFLFINNVMFLLFSDFENIKNTLLKGVFLISNTSTNG
jgi:hypothetical protein